MQPGSVEEYYDTNTLPFLRFGGSGVGVAAIHRQVWAPGVKDASAAFEYSNQLVLEWLLAESGAGSPVLDLGCGIGGTATWIAKRSQLQVTGVTLSRVQADLAEKRAERLGVGTACRFVCGDMTALPFDDVFAGAYAIESLIHVADTERFFTAAARALSPGARLVVCDDFLAEGTALGADAEPNDRAAHWLATFRDGWRAHGLVTASGAKRAAAHAGFELVEERNLTPYLRTVSPLLVTLGAAALRLPFLTGSYWDSLRGSTALQRCVREGFTTYRALCWVRR
jgi:cyclopropane fatty-acyl-phospholipid synthase-like methyltransferase